MLGNRECVSLNGAPDARGSHLNELDDAAGSSRSSFEDIWDSTSIEVRMNIVVKARCCVLTKTRKQCNVIPICKLINCLDLQRFLHVLVFVKIIRSKLS